MHVVASSSGERLRRAGTSTGPARNDISGRDSSQTHLIGWGADARAHGVYKKYCPRWVFEEVVGC